MWRESVNKRILHFCTNVPFCTIRIILYNLYYSQFTIGSLSNDIDDTRFFAKSFRRNHNSWSSGEKRDYPESMGARRCFSETNSLKCYFLVAGELAKCQKSSPEGSFAANGRRASTVKAFPTFRKTLIDDVSCIRRGENVRWNTGHSRSFLATIPRPSRKLIIFARENRHFRRRGRGQQAFQKFWWDSVGSASTTRDECERCAIEGSRGT